MTAAFAGANAAAMMTTILRDRRTVRVTYHRGSDILSLDVVCGDRVEQHVLALALNANDIELRESMEAAIERGAQTIARRRGLDVSRLDVD